jgi:hypothetical protein
VLPFRILPMTRYLPALLLAAACGGERAPAPPPEVPPASSVAPAAPRVTITAPAPGDTTGRDVAIVLSAEGITIAPASGTREPGVAHHHLFLDRDASGADAAIPAAEGVVHLGTGDSTYVYPGLTPGPHRVIAVLAWGDHVPVEGAGRDTADFVVR